MYLPCGASQPPCENPAEPCAPSIEELSCVRQLRICLLELLARVALCARPTVALVSSTRVELATSGFEELAVARHRPRRIYARKYCRRPTRAAERRVLRLQPRSQVRNPQVALPNFRLPTTIPRPVRRLSMATQVLQRIDAGSANVTLTTFARCARRQRGTPAATRAGARTSTARKRGRPATLR